MVVGVGIVLGKECAIKQHEFYLFSSLLKSSLASYTCICSRTVFFSFNIFTVFAFSFFKYTSIIRFFLLLWDFLKKRRQNFTLKHGFLK